MNKQIALEWADELESGKYKQGRGYLANQEGHCCLGVLCEIAAEKGIVDKKLTEEINPCFQFDHLSTYLPDSVKKWAGMKSYFGKWADGEYTSLVYLNDNGKDFKFIAQTIREKVAEL